MKETHENGTQEIRNTKMEWKEKTRSRIARKAKHEHRPHGMRKTNTECKDGETRKRITKIATHENGLERNESTKTERKG